VLWGGVGIISYLHLMNSLSRIEVLYFEKHIRIPIAARISAEVLAQWR